ncbi:MAG TPA: hypothetical protein VHY09_03580 [Candidatus Methylacidiphilales bacterium]|jgi:hypothetical protein|nr:hypothetical protein [Candidatus Methylacidiphilales bacterium]
MWRAIRLIFGYIGLLLGGVVWFICFPLSVYTLNDSGQFPLDYFGIHVYLGFPLDFFLPKDMWRAVAGICAAFTLYGLVTIYFNVRKLRRLRRGEKA